MPRFFDVPNELIFKIVDYVQTRDPYDIEALALCCKAMRSALTDKLQIHKSDRERYSMIATGWSTGWWNPDSHEGSIHPIVDLVDVLNDERRRGYIKSMKIGDIMAYSDEEEVEASIQIVATLYGDLIDSSTANINSAILPN